MGEYMIKINPDGSEVEIDAKGFIGTGCKDGIKNVLKALGTTIEEKKKDSYHKKEHAGQQVGA